MNFTHALFYSFPLQELKTTVCLWGPSTTGGAGKQRFSYWEEARSLFCRYWFQKEHKGRKSQSHCLTLPRSQMEQKHRSWTEAKGKDPLMHWLQKKDQVYLLLNWAIQTAASQQAKATKHLVAYSLVYFHYTTVGRRAWSFFRPK